MKLNWRALTEAFIMAGIIGYILYDVVAFTEGGVSATISDVVNQQAYTKPWMVFLAGFLCGHLFWRLNGRGPAD